ATLHSYTLSLHDALPICPRKINPNVFVGATNPWSALPTNYEDDTLEPDIHPDMSKAGTFSSAISPSRPSIQGTNEYQDYLNTGRSEEHTSELQSLTNLVC